MAKVALDRLPANDPHWMFARLAGNLQRPFQCWRRLEVTHRLGAKQKQCTTPPSELFVSSSQPLPPGVAVYGWQSAGGIYRVVTLCKVYRSHKIGALS